MHNINWGDVPTWLAVVVATIGAAAALRQLRQQGDVIKDEIERNRARDALVDGQLRELRDREHARAREQAEQIDLTWSARSDSASFVQVVNDSRRPIRNVACRIQRENSSIVKPKHMAELLPTTVAGVEGWTARSADMTPGPVVPAVRGGGRAGFDFSSPRNPSCDRLMTRFTDDAESHWELDHYLHLARLDNRDDW